MESTLLCVCQDGIDVGLIGKWNPIWFTTMGHKNVPQTLAQNCALPLWGQSGWRDSIPGPLNSLIGKCKHPILKILSIIGLFFGKKCTFCEQYPSSAGTQLTTSELKVCCLNHWTDALLLSPPYMEHDKDLVLHWPSQWSPAKVLNAVLLMQRKIYIFVGPIDLSKIFKIIQIFFWGGDKLKAFKNFFTTPLCTSFSLTRLGDL